PADARLGREGAAEVAVFVGASGQLKLQIGQQGDVELGIGGGDVALAVHGGDGGPDLQAGVDLPGVGRDQAFAADLDAGGVTDLTGGQGEQLARDLEVGAEQARLRRAQGGQGDAV